MSAPLSPMVWSHQSFVLVVERLAKHDGFLDIWSADRDEIRRYCQTAVLMLNDIVSADKQYLVGEVGTDVEDALETYRFYVSIEIQRLRQSLSEGNARISRSLQSGVSPRRALAHLATPQIHPQRPMMMHPIRRA